MVAFHTRFVAAEAGPRASSSRRPKGRGRDAARLRIGARMLVNAAGLFAGEVAAATDGLAPPHRREILLLQGQLLRRRRPGAVPPPDLPGARARRPRRAPDPRHGRAGRASARTPNGSRASTTASTPAAATASTPRSAATGRSSPTARSRPSYTGIRPKLFPEGGAATDFAIEGPEVHGLPGLVNLFGIESPGLTASLAIADEVAARLDGM